MKQFLFLLCLSSLNIAFAQSNQNEKSIVTGNSMFSPAAENLSYNSFRQKRIALVIGGADYQYIIPQLPQDNYDVDSLKFYLKRLNFDVVVVNNKPLSII